MNQANLIIDVKNLVKRYGKYTALDHFNLQVRQGEILGLLGPNGSGKSTSINCILSLLSYDKGEINLFGEAMTPQKTNLKKRIGIVPQDVAVFDELTVYQNIDYFCGLYITDKAKRKKYIKDAIEIVQLQDFTKFLPGNLSGGLKRRLNIACGIAHKPDLIFLDEPTVAVDPQSRNSILESIQTLNKNGATIVYTSHYMEEIEQLCTNIMIMDKGHILAQGTKEALKEMIQTGEKIIIELPVCPPSLLTHTQNMRGVIAANFDGDNLHIETVKDEHVLIDLLHYLETNRILFGNFYSLQPTLNDVFLEITGKELRD